MKLKFLSPLLGVVTGISLSYYFLPGMMTPALLMGGALFSWLALHILSRNPLRGKKLSYFHHCWIFLFFTSIGALDFDFNCALKLEKEITDDKLHFIGEVEEVKCLADGDRLKVKINSITDSLGNEIKNHGLIMLLKTDGALASPGERILFFSKAKKINNVYPQKFADRFLQQGISYCANAKYNEIEYLGKSFSISSIFTDLRNRLIIEIENSSLKRPTGEFLISIILGNKSFLSSETRLTLTSAGMAHILALSGMHVAIILSILLFILYPFSFLGYRKTRFICAIVLLWAYVALTGSSPSTLRAALMATFMVGAIILERKNSSLNALLATSTFILLISPFYLWDIGLQLSFLCVLGIILFVNRLNPIDQKKHNLLYKIYGGILVTLSTTFFTWSLTAYYFEEIPLLFLPSNLILLPLLPFFVGFGTLYLFLLTINIDFQILGKCLDGFHYLFIEGADLLSLNGVSTLKINLPIITVITWLIAMIILSIALYHSKKQIRKLSYIFGASLALSSFIFLFLPKEEEAFSLKFLHSPTKISVNLLSSDLPKELKFPRNGIASCRYKNFHILSIDSPLKEDALLNIKMKNYDILEENNSGISESASIISNNEPMFSSDKPAFQKNKEEKNLNRFLLIGPQADLTQMAEIIENSDFAKIVLHAGIGKNQKEELLTLLHESYWDTIYSLRENGSLEFLLE